MRYLIILSNGEVFETPYYEYSNNWSDKIFMIINLDLQTYSTNGISFKEINQDHL